jgi:homogentisate 1,2-dioxygenase
MPHYMQLGSLPPKRHTRHEAHPGYRNEGIYYEEVITTQGFSRAYSIVYHLRPPTRVKHIEPIGIRPLQSAPQEVLRHVHLKTGGIESMGDPITGRVPLLFNADVTMSRCRPANAQQELYRNARSDELLFVHAGHGKLVTHFGELPFRPMDYIVIRRPVSAWGSVLRTRSARAQCATYDRPKRRHLDRDQRWGSMDAVCTRQSSVRCGGLGRDGVPVYIQRG